MKKTIVVAASAAVLALGLFGSTALADNPNWSSEKAYQIQVNRCADAGVPNGGEDLGTGVCRHTPGGEPKDLDPGNSMGHNQAARPD